MTTTSDKKKLNAYELVTEMILEKIDNGVAPWIKPWNSFSPKNLTTGKEYRGINNVILSMLGGDSALFTTFRQIKQLGHNVNKGAKSLPVVFHMFEDLDPNEDEKGRDRVYKGARTYRVFRVEDTSMESNDIQNMYDIEEFIPLNETLRIDRIEEALKAMTKTVRVKHGTSGAHYQPSSHTIGMPKYDKFKSIDGYYSTFFHELVHSTAKELGRDLDGHFGTKDYSFEELVAELGSAFLCSHFQVDNSELEQSASYIKGWSSKFREDKKMIFKASSLAQKAVDLLLNRVDEIPF